MSKIYVKSMYTFNIRKEQSKQGFRKIVRNALEPNTVEEEIDEILGRHSFHYNYNWKYETKQLLSQLLDQKVKEARIDELQNIPNEIDYFTAKNNNYYIKDRIKQLTNKD